MIDPSLILEPPRPSEHPENKLWIDEQIWGHRLWDDQSPWLVFLEFLNLAEACHRDGKLLDAEGVHYPLRFRPYKRMHLRNILFNNERLIDIAKLSADNETAWTEWLSWMHDNAKGVFTDFSYLKSRFHSFHEFVSLVGMLRSSAVESNTNRRWSSRFVFPFGPHGLYEDLHISPSGGVSREYINFGLTGELLYKMLCASECAEKVRPCLAQMLNGNNVWDQLLRRLQPADSDDLSTRGNSYLPYRKHYTFDRLGEDWLNICQLQLPGFDSYPYLATLSALHTVMYQLNLASQWSGCPKPYFICEVLAPKKTLIRELAASSYQSNNLLTPQAIDVYIKEIEESPDWQDAAIKPGCFEICRQILIKRVRWPTDSADYNGCNDPQTLLAELRRVAKSRHEQHAGSVHRSYGRDIGMVSKRGTTKLRYAPNDSLLKALVLANVKSRMEFNEFLTCLFARYGLIFGGRQAEQVLDKGEFDTKAFQANSERLEQRLASLGMLRRLSDACAYVLNPFSFLR